MVLNGAANRDPRQFEDPAEFASIATNARSTSRSATASTRAPARRSRAPRAASRIERILDRTSDIRVSDADARSRRGSPLRVRPDLHPPRPPATPPGVHARRHERRRRAVRDPRRRRGARRPARPPRARRASPTRSPGTGWEYGIPIGYLRELVEYWRDEYDWRGAGGAAQRAPAVPHRRSTGSRSTSCTRARRTRTRSRCCSSHGWPGSIVEFLDVIPASPTPRPRRRAADAFHVVAPSLPGYGFSEPTRDARLGHRRASRARSSS